MRNTTSLKTIAVFSALIIAVLTFATPASASLKGADIEGVSLVLAQDEDVLTVKLSESRDPRVSRYGMLKRIVIDFPDSVALASFHSLLDKKRGSCVERYELHSFERTSLVTTFYGTQREETRTSTLLVAYVEDGVDVDLDVAGGLVTARFHRISHVKPQPRPSPMNELKNITYEKQGSAEFLTFESTMDVFPEIYETTKPYRILITFPNTLPSNRVENQIFRYMETPGMFRVETFGIGSVPSPYDRLDESGQYHFVGVPTPLAVTAFKNKEIGMQNDDVVVAIFPDKKVKYSIIRQQGASFEIAFEKRLRYSDLRKLEMEKACSVIERSLAEEVTYYGVEDEEGREIDY